MQPTSQPARKAFALPSPRKKPLMWAAIAGACIMIVITAVVLWNMNRQKVTAGSEAHVSITDTGVVPATITVRKGQTLTIINNSSNPHSLTADSDVAPGFETPDTLNPSETFVYSFEKTGKLTFYDPDAPVTHNGTVIVE